MAGGNIFGGSEDASRGPQSSSRRNSATRAPYGMAGDVPAAAPARARHDHGDAEAPWAADEHKSPTRRSGRGRYAGCDGKRWCSGTCDA